MGNSAARISDFHSCSEEASDEPHVGGPVMFGVPAAKLGSVCQCNGSPDSVAMGSGAVLIGSAPAARMGVAKAHGA